MIAPRSPENPWAEPDPPPYAGPSVGGYVAGTVIVLAGLFLLVSMVVGAIGIVAWIAVLIRGLAG